MYDLTSLVRMNSASADEAQRQLAELAARNRAAVEQDRQKIARSRNGSAKPEEADRRAADGEVAGNCGGGRHEASPSESQAAVELMHMAAVWPQVQSDVRSALVALVASLAVAESGKEGAHG